MSMNPCAHTECGQDAVSCCDSCDTSFCEEHGRKGGDHEGGEGDRGPYGAYAVPSICWKCEERLEASE